MILTTENTLYTVNGITDVQQNSAIDFLQGAVYCWCKNRPDEWFALRDLMGGENTFWAGTPLMPIYNKHSHLSDDEAFTAAAKDAGWLLKRAIVNDSRIFDTEKSGIVRRYKWYKKV